MAQELTDYILKLRELGENASQKLYEEIAVPEDSKLLGTIKNRIILEGKNSAGQSTGHYSTTPAYFDRGAFIQQGKFKAVGKTGKTKKKDGTPHKSMYLPQGYKELRQIQGRESSFKNNEYTGSLMASYQMQVKPEAKTNVLGFTLEKSAAIRRGLEAKQGQTFSATKEEMEHHNKRILDATVEITKKYLT